MFALLLLLVLPSLSAGSPDHLRPGALVASTGQVSLVEDYLWLKYDVADLFNVPDKLIDVTQQLDESIKGLKGTHVPDALSRLLRDRLQFLKLTLQDAVDNYSAIHAARRAKRGLVDGVGHISRMLFGTALDSDVKNLQERFDNLETASINTNRLVHLNCENIKRLNDNIHTVLNYTNALSKTLHEVITQQYEEYTFHEVSLLLSSLEISVNSIVNSNSIILRNIVDASRSKVTSSLLPVKDLTHALTVAARNFSLVPLFTGADVIHYYPLLSSLLLSDALVVHVPFKVLHTYRMFLIEPFPFLAKSTVLTLNLPPSLVLENTDGTQYAVSNPSELSHCKTEHVGLYFCPASLFAFLPLTKENTCELSLIRKDTSSSLSLCPYNQLTNSSFFHKSFLGYHYFLFLEPMYISVNCGKGHYSSTISGHFSIPKLCSLTSSKINTHQETLHRSFMHVSTIPHVSNIFTPFTLSNISGLDAAVQESLSFLSHSCGHHVNLINPLVLFYPQGLGILYKAHWQTSHQRVLWNKVRYTVTREDARGR